ncbi:MAG: adenylate/guanylate cyclase domain-containing protein [Candidatus Limnocylindria bacterium]
MRRLRFRTKIFLALGGIACVSLALVLVLLQELTVRRVRESAQERFERTLTAFRRLEDLRARFLSDEIESLAGSNPQFRTILSTASLAQADLGFGGGGDVGEALHDANLRLESLAPSLAVFAKNDVVLVANAEGDLLYSKAEPGRFGDGLGALPLLRSIAATGDGQALLRAGERTASGALLAPERPGPALFLVRGRPILFDGELHGIVLVGQELGAEVLADLRAISGIDLALVSRGELVATTLNASARASLAERPAGGASARGIQEWPLAGERFLVRRATVIEGAAPGDAEFLLLSSLDVELAFLRRLSQLLLAVGGGILLAALAASLALARGITRPVAALGRAARRVGAGELDTRVEITTGDELAELGGAFNEMVAGLRERDLIKRSFERYVSKAVADEVLRNPTLAKLGGSRREITAMFVDLGGFTGLAETLAPEAVVSHLNEYFEAACGAILGEEGAVSEFQGDGIVAFWGAPLAHPDDAARACLAALGCEEALAALRARWMARGLPRLRFRIGLHTGEMVVGEVGSAERGKYAVVGDAMNLASRIEGANKLFGSRILISEATRQRAGDAVECRELDAIRVVGRQQPVRVFEVLARGGHLDAARTRAREAFAAGLAAYRARDWDAAQRGFAEAAGQDPGDAPARSFLERVAALREQPLPPDWDGIFELTAK